MAHARAKNLNDGDIAGIVSILDGWIGKLSWELLIEAIERRHHATYTRQALHKHERIRHAFVLRKQAIVDGKLGGAPKVELPELQAALERIARLESENARLEAENQQLLGQFASWAYNAHMRGLDQAYLNQPLPSVNRDQTDRPLRAVKQPRSLTQG